MTTSTVRPERGLAEALLNDWLADQQRQLGIVGIAGVVVLPGGDTLTAAHGLADREHEIPMTTDTPMRMASITKMFTVTAMLMARDAGLLSLDAPVSDLVPELSSVTSPARDPVPITLRQVVSHTAGLPHDLPYGVQYWDRDGTDVAFPSAQVAREYLSGLRLIYSPMTTHHYSNVGYMIVGLAVAAAFGQPYEEVVRDRILKPLAMERSFFWSAASIGKLARGYRPEGSGLAVAPNMDVGWDTAGGGLCCSATDLASFIKLHLSDLPAGGAQVLGGSSVREAQQPVFMMPGWTAGTGLGWRLRRANDETIVAHSGGIAGFAAHMALVPALGIGAALLCNTNRAQVPPLLEGMLESVATAIKTTREIEHRYRPKELPPGFDQVTGHYATYEASYDVIAADGRFAIVPFGELGHAAWLEPTDERGHFVGATGFACGEPVVFRQPRDGSFTELMLQGHLFRRV